MIKTLASSQRYSSGQYEATTHPPFRTATEQDPCCSVGSYRLNWLLAPRVAESGRRNRLCCGRRLWRMDDRLLVLNRDDDCVSVVDPQTGETVTEIDTAFGPQTVENSPDAMKSYVSYSQGNTLLIIDNETFEITGRLTHGWLAGVRDEQQNQRRLSDRYRTASRSRPDRCPDVSGRHYVSGAPVAVPGAIRCFSCRPRSR